MQKVPPALDKESYLETCKILLEQNLEFTDKFKIHNDPNDQDKMILVSKTYVSDKRARTAIFDDEEEEQINANNEIRYIESGEEQKIAQEAGESRPYSEFFEEFVPNMMEESKRKHKYTVSLHRAICTQETLEVFR